MKLDKEVEYLDLKDVENASQFYNDRYKGDYMDEWPIHKKRRIYELLKKLGLPEEGTALDYGCGTGVFTYVIKQALPRWQVWGTDLSTVALKKAQEKNPNCIFFSLDSPALIARKFDFIFSHHVLEHVSDIDETWMQFLQLSKPGTRMLHICPCGNEGSFEYNLCRLRKNGLRQHPKNTFFYEEQGHLRKLDTQQMRLLAAKHGFEVCQENYAWHYYEAIEGLTIEGVNFIRDLTDPTQAVNEEACNQLSRLRMQLQILAILRTPMLIHNQRLQKQKKSFQDYAVIMILQPFTVISWVVDRILKHCANSEWHKRRNDPAGAEMYFMFKCSDC
jgi:SAM-dependent methyltransferase